MSLPLHIIGAGGHAKVVLDTAKAAGYTPVALYDQNQAVVGNAINGVPVVHIDHLPQQVSCIIAIGSNQVRAKMATQFAHRVRFVSLVHPSAVIGFGVNIGEGSVVMAGAIIQPDTIIGQHCIINTAASIDHDGNIADFVHVAPGCRLAGNVTLEKFVFCGIGTVCIPGIKIAENTVIAAGSTVVNNIPKNVLALGTPAKPYRNL
jgi:sugar O-acyltransferase (sialic acid O-acetyltransferase NeuD family)